jgi:hypothetical protein
MVIHKNIYYIYIYIRKTSLKFEEKILMHDLIISYWAELVLNKMMSQSTTSLFYIITHHQHGTNDDVRRVRTMQSS